MKQWVAKVVGRRVCKISAITSCFHFVGSEETVSRAKREFVSSCLCILYLAPGISNPYLNFKSLFEFQIPLAQNYPAGTSELIPLVPTQIYVEIIRNVDIVLLAQNYPAVTSEIFPLGSNSYQCRNFPLCRNFLAGV